MTTLEEKLAQDNRSNAMYLAGGYDICKRLLTSPRFNRPQREVIEEVAEGLRERYAVQADPTILDADERKD